MHVMNTLFLLTSITSEGFNRQTENVWLIDITDFIYISIIGLCKAWSNCLSPNETYLTVNKAAEELYLNNSIKVYPPDAWLSLE